MARTKSKILILIISLLLIRAVTGCSAYELRNFRGSKSEYVNIAFKYPREWRLRPINVGRGNAIETWELEIPGRDSKVTLSFWPQSSPDEAHALLNEDSIFLSDIEGIIRENIDVCGNEFDLFRYYQPESVYDDFVVQEADIINLNFVNGNVYNVFSAEILRTEQAAYDDIEEDFLSIINSIKCK